VDSNQETPDQESVTPPLPSLFQVLETAFTAQRMDAFTEKASDPDWLRLSRYCYNLAMAEAFYPALHMLEVTLRNVVYNAVAAAYPTKPGEGIDLDCWLDRRAPLLHSEATRLVSDAKEAIRRDRRTLEIGRLIAELKFGFWTMLFSGYYGAVSEADPRFWPLLLPKVFPSMPEKDRTRSSIADLLHKARALRNRLFHHEPIWQRKVYRDYRDITRLIEWMNPAAAALTEKVSRFAQVEGKGKAQFNNAARELVAEWRARGTSPIRG
jgi:hypothetical protein